MSSKLVRKGLDLVNNEGGLRSEKRKSTLKEKQPAKKRKQASKPNRQKTRGVQLQGLRLSSGQTKKTQQADYTEQNLEYFKKATWKIKKDTYDKILERQSKQQRYKNPEEKDSESKEETGGLFDD